MLVDLCCVTVCVFSQTHTLTPTHTEREGADDLVWSRLDSPLLPPLPERSLSAGDQDDSLSLKRFPENTYNLLYIMYIHSGVCVCCGVWPIKHTCTTDST